MSETNSTHHKAPLGLRTVAVYEFTKGLLVLVVGVGLLSFVHKDIQTDAEGVLRALRLDPGWHYCKLLIENSAKLTDNRLRLIAALAAFYSAIRFVITYGLWREKHWAEWLTAISAGIYIPYEIYHLIRRPGWTALLVPVLNIAVVVYLTRVILANRRRRLLARSAMENPS